MVTMRYNNKRINEYNNLIFQEIREQRKQIKIIARNGLRQKRIKNVNFQTTSATAISQNKTTLNNNFSYYNL